MNGICHYADHVYGWSGKNTYFYVKYIPKNKSWIKYMSTTHGGVVQTLVEKQYLVRLFSPSWTLEPRLKGWHRRGH
jgi:hypothetical protein